MRVILAVLAIASFASCTPLPQEPVKVKSDDDTICPGNGGWCVQRMVDDKYGVVCYKYLGYGISCVKVAP